METCLLLSCCRFPSQGWIGRMYGAPWRCCVTIFLSPQMATRGAVVQNYSLGPQPMGWVGWPGLDMSRGSACLCWSEISSPLLPSCKWVHLRVSKKSDGRSTSSEQRESAGARFPSSQPAGRAPAVQLLLSYNHSATRLGSWGSRACHHHSFLLESTIASIPTNRTRSQGRGRVVSA